MTEPYRCPNCNGSGRLPDPRSISGSDMSVPEITCHSCKGKGIVWTPPDDHEEWPYEVKHFAPAKEDVAA